jgi:hypothetical protein
MPSGANKTPSSVNSAATAAASFLLYASSSFRPSAPKTLYAIFPNGFFHKLIYPTIALYRKKVLTLKSKTVISGIPRNVAARINLIDTDKRPL